MPYGRTTLALSAGLSVLAAAGFARTPHIPRSKREAQLSSGPIVPPAPKKRRLYPDLEDQFRMSAATAKRERKAAKRARDFARQAGGQERERRAIS